MYNIPTGALKVLYHSEVNVISCNGVVNCMDRHTARTDFKNEIETRVKHHMSYTQRLHNIIDELIADDSVSESPKSVTYEFDTKFVNKCQDMDVDMTDKYNRCFPHSLTAHIEDHVGDNNKIYCDAAIPDKNVGFLSHSVAKFSFTGPDRLPVDITSVEQCLHIAEAIASTGRPNYAQARIPLASGLNIEEWEKELMDYPDKMLIECLKFGFPLSLSDPDSLHNTNIVNHH